MKPYILSLLLVLSSQTQGRAQQAPLPGHQQLQAVVVGLFDALSELNAGKARSFCTADVSILESGKVWTFDSLALRITTRKKLSADFKRVNTFNFIETKALGETAWIAYFNEAVITASGKTVTVKWLESVVLKKMGSEWKIVLLHSTELSRTPQ